MTRPSLPVPRFGRLRGGLLAIVSAVVVLCVAVPGQAQAQSCSADSQCPDAGRSSATCVGDTLVVKRSVCAGSCREVEERRQSCGSRVIGSIACQGNIAVRSEGGCNAISQSCDSRVDREVCVATCACRGNRLIVSTGTCVSGAGCARSVVQCKNGCTCKPEPACT